jgi:2-C-methyl-D-erythritol 4-phosphate cytidylyltransferase/2-C-methyl-D-erythritol 2,4-cyclodiphosphate synthase
VGLHSLTDAILGALGEGDIGHHFPPNDDKWKDADSTIFLAHAARLVKERQGRINHADITLICEAPKLNPYRAAMLSRIEDILELPSDHISIKATTTERLGFTGRGEGIAAQATATITLPG